MNSIKMKKARSLSKIFYSHYRQGTEEKFYSRFRYSLSLGLIFPFPTQARLRES